MFTETILHCLYNNNKIKNKTPNTTAMGNIPLGGDCVTALV